MLPQEMLVAKRIRDGHSRAFYRNSHEGEMRDFFQQKRYMRGIRNISPPAKGGVACNENGSHCKRIDVREPAGDTESGITLIFRRNLCVLHVFSHGYGAAKIVGMRSAEAGNFMPRLRPCGGMTRMGVSDSPDARKGVVKGSVRREVGRWPERSLHDVSGEIGNYEISGFHSAVRHAARLDNDQAALAIDSACVAERFDNQAITNQREIGFEHLFAQIFKHV
jgi:hypothetical protein